MRQIAAIIIVIGLYCLWGGGAILAVRALGLDLPITSGVVLALMYAHATFFGSALVVLLAVIAFAQPRKSADNLKAVTDAFQKAAEQAMSSEVADLVQKAREEAIGKDAEAFLRRKP